MTNETSIVTTPDEEMADRLVLENESKGYSTRPLSVEEGLRRLQQRATLARFGVSVPAEGLEEKHAREVREADVVEAARRSQAEIRRHVDSYLKEHFETIAADIATVVVRQVHERLLKGEAAIQEQQMIHLDRIAGDVRRDLRAFMRGAWSEAKTTTRAPRAPSSKGKSRDQAKRPHKRRST